MSEREPIDDLPPELRAMLDATREPEGLPAPVEARMLRALDARIIAAGVGDAPTKPRQGPLHRVPWSAVGAFVLGAIFGAVAYRLAAPEPAPREVVRERVVTRERVVREPSAPAPAPAQPPAPQGPPTPEAPPAPASRDDRDDRDDLAAEQALLDRARIALRNGDVTGALDRVTEHARRFRRGQLEPERELLRVRALVAAGRRDEAAAVAERFRRRHPGHALRGAVESALR